jgi:hypothetical protein
MLEPAHMDEVARHIEYVRGLRDRNAPGVETWLGESGGAQCGGEPGVSDRYESSLWWLDQLGQAAASGQRVVVRQTLVGSHYGLLDDETLQPRPDYWASLLWKRLMGTRALDITRAPPQPHLRTYAHCSRQDGAGAVTLLALNTDRHAAHHLRLPELDATRARLYHIQAASLDAGTIQLNGRPLTLGSAGVLPTLEATALPSMDVLQLPPASYAFVVYPEAAARACADDRGADTPTRD